jgi:hypothetical protein
MNSPHHRQEKTTYEIRVQGKVDEKWADWFNGLTFCYEQAPAGASGGIPTTVMTGVIADQAALHGILARIRDLNLRLLSVNQIRPQQEA